MTRGQINVRWAVTIVVSGVLIILLLAILPRLPAFNELYRRDGSVDNSTVDSRMEGGENQTVFVVTLEGDTHDVFVVMKGADAGYYRATQTVASGDDVTIWTYPLARSSDQRIWQLSDRGQLIVSYNEVYGFEKRWHNQLIEGILLLIVIINLLNALIIKNQTSEPPPLPRMLEFGD